VAVAELLADLGGAKAPKRLSRLEEQLERLDHLICGKLGFVSRDAGLAHLLFGLLAQRYSRAALAITSTLEYADWPKALKGDSRPVAALLDRLTPAAICRSSEDSPLPVRPQHGCPPRQCPALADLNGATSRPEAY